MIFSLSVDQSNPQYYLKRAGLYVLLDRSNDALRSGYSPCPLTGSVRCPAAACPDHGENARYRKPLLTMNECMFGSRAKRCSACTVLTATSRWETMRKPSPPTIQQQKALPEYADAIAYARGVCFTPQRTMKRLLQTCCNICLLPLKMES